MQQDLEILINKGFRYALSLTHNRDSAQDLVQEAWVAVLQAKGERSVPYLFSAIRTRFFNKNRRAQLVEIVSLNIDNPEHVEIHEDENTLLEIDSGTLNAALAGLRTVEREVIFLAIVEGYSASEISALTDINRNTVLSQLKRGKEKLRQQLTPLAKKVRPS